MSDKLAPVRCGCGGKARVETVTTRFEQVPRYRIRCNQCNISTIWDYFSEAEAIEAWNRAMGWGKPKWCCNFCDSYDKQRCYCNLHGIWVASDFGCKAWEPEGMEEDE